MRATGRKTKSDSIIELRHDVHIHGAPLQGNILMVASSPAVSPVTGWPIGFWASELTHPLLRFREAGFDVTLASTEGGAIEMDGYSNPHHESGYSTEDVITMGFLKQSWFTDMLNNTKKITDVYPDLFDAIFLVGGQGPMVTFRNNKKLESLFSTFFVAGKPSAAVCHATTLLLTAKGSNGDLLVKNRAWTGFSNAEEDAAEEAVGQQIQPYRIEDEARTLLDTDFRVSKPFSSYAIRDGNLITGQQQNSGRAAASLVVDLLVSQN